MKRIIMKFALAATASAALVGLAEQAQAETRFVGRIIFTAKSGTCDWDPVGNRAQIRFTPANVGDNGSDSSLSQFDDDWGGLGATLVGGSFNTTLKAVRAYDIWGGAWSRSGVKVKFSTQTPATILTTTNLVNVTGQLQNWVGGPLCVVTFRMSLVRAVN